MSAVRRRPQPTVVDWLMAAAVVAQGTSTADLGDHRPYPLPPAAVAVAVTCLYTV